MIEIKRKEDCCGCSACVQICPKQCITFDEDEQGFRYPKVNLEQCINCGLCEKVCPVLNQIEPTQPLHAYAAKNIDEQIQSTSSSGGVFFAMARHVIDKGGIVFGARFDADWKVVHDYAETLHDAEKFKCSKYSQSVIGNSYRQTEEFLKGGRLVLFSGTPCQISGLRLFLKKKYDNLYLVDFACHGVPSPMIWSEYLRYISSANGFGYNTIDNISFRDKRNGWSNYGIRIAYRKLDCYSEWYQSFEKNIYMQGFLNDLYLRPSCFACPAKSCKSGSDITLADFWGIKNLYQELYMERYFSLILSNTKRGIQWLENLEISKIPVDYSIAVHYNPTLVKSPHAPVERKIFWDRWPRERLSCISPIVNGMKDPLKRRIKRKLFIIITQLFRYIKLKTVDHAKFGHAINRLTSIIRKPL